MNNINTKHFTNFEYLVRSDFLLKNEREVIVLFSYQGIHRIKLSLFINKVEGRNDEHYINEAKKIINKKIKNGSLEKYCEAQKKKNTHKKALTCLIALASIGAVTGVSVGTYFALTSASTPEVKVDVPEITGLTFSNTKAYIGKDYNTDISINKTTSGGFILPNTLKNVTSGNRTVLATEYTYSVEDNKESGSLYIPGKYIEGDVTIDLELVAPTGAVVVTFVTNCDKQLSPVAISKGSKINQPEIEWEGHSLVNWYSNESLNEVFDFNTSIEENTTLYAYWLEGDVNEPFTLTCTQEGSKLVIAHDGSSARAKSFDLWYQIVEPSGSEQDWKKFPDVTQQTETTTEDLTNIAFGTKIRFAGDNDYFSCQTEHIYFATDGYDTTSFDLSGNVMSLLSRNDFAHLDQVSDHEFEQLFYPYMVSLSLTITDASNFLLPATKLGNHCYDSMFYGAKFEHGPKELPACDLSNASYAYCYMFYAAASLTKAPYIAATTFANDAMKNMFKGCKKLGYLEVAFGKDGWPVDSSGNNPTTDWLSNAAGTEADTPTFIWAGSGEPTRDEHHVPSGWSIQSK